MAHQCSMAYRERLRATSTQSMTVAGTDMNKNDTPDISQKTANIVQQSGGHQGSNRSTSIATNIVGKSCPGPIGGGGDSSREAQSTGAGAEPCSGTNC